MHTDNRRVDHLHRRIMGFGQRVHNPAPDASPSPPDEAAVRFGRDVPESARITLTLSFVESDPRRMGPQDSIWLDVCCPDHLAPFFDLGGDQIAEVDW